MKDAKIAQLSPATQAIIAYHPSGRPIAITFVKGSAAFTLGEPEARRLREALA